MTVQKSRSATQTELVLDHMRRHGSITALDAMNHYGCMRLAARIKDLRDDGFTILTDSVKSTTGAQYARYRLAELGDAV